VSVTWCVHTAVQAVTVWQLAAEAKPLQQEVLGQG
jgi:hypothetical protein